MVKKKISRKKIHYLKLREKISRKRPKFVRYESWRYKRVKPNWRRARGIDSKVREKRKGYIKSPTVGYRSPKYVRGLHPSGLKPILIYNEKDLDKINPKIEAAVIGSKVGILKRIRILERADRLNIKVLNPGRALLREAELPELETFEEI